MDPITLTVSSDNPLYALAAFFKHVQDTAATQAAEIDTLKASLLSAANDLNAALKGIDEAKKQVAALTLPEWFKQADAVLTAGLYCMNVLKIPYKFGGTFETTKSFDCSSFMQSIFHLVGVGLPRVSRDQAAFGTEVALADVRPGDLLFFDPDLDGVISHVGVVYYDTNKMLHTANPTEGMAIVDYKTRYPGVKFKTARRVIS